MGIDPTRAEVIRLQNELDIRKDTIAEQRAMIGNLDLLRTGLMDILGRDTNGMLMVLEQLIPTLKKHIADRFETIAEQAEKIGRMGSDLVLFAKRAEHAEAESRGWEERFSEMVATAKEQKPCRK